MKEKLLPVFCLAMTEETEQHYKNGNLQHHIEIQTISFLKNMIFKETEITNLTVSHIYF